jgi:hypothetical protein
MATVITTLGKTKTLKPHTKTILKITNNPNIKSIIRIEPSILDVFIEDNANLVDINLGRRGLRNLHIINNPLLTSVQALPITQSVIIKDNPLVNYDTLINRIQNCPIINKYMPYIEIINPNTNEGCVYQQINLSKIIFCHPITFNSQLDGGTRKNILINQLSKTRKLPREKPVCPFVFKKTSFGMPIMYLVRK